MRGPDGTDGDLNRRLERAPTDPPSGPPGRLVIPLGPDVVTGSAGAGAVDDLSHRLPAFDVSFFDEVPQPTEAKPPHGRARQVLRVVTGRGDNQSFGDFLEGSVPPVDPTVVDAGLPAGVAARVEGDPRPTARGVPRRGGSSSRGGRARPGRRNRRASALATMAFVFVGLAIAMVLAAAPPAHERAGGPGRYSTTTAGAGGSNARLSAGGRATGAPAGGRGGSTPAPAGSVDLGALPTQPVGSEGLTPQAGVLPLSTPLVAGMPRSTQPGTSTPRNIPTSPPATASPAPPAAPPPTDPPATSPPPTAPPPTSPPPTSPPTTSPPTTSPPTDCPTWTSHCHP